MKRRDIVHYGIADHFIASRKSKRTFLDDVEELVDWTPIEKFLNKKLNRKANVVGTPAFPAIMMFKIILLQQWYGLSDPAMEVALYDRISFIKFIHYSIEQKMPDETTICRFRNGLTRLDIYQELLDMVNFQFEKKGLFVREGAIVDATVVESASRPRKSVEVVAEDRSENSENSVDSEESSQNYKSEVTYSDDTDATWLSKGGKFHYGYKIHVAVDNKLGMILANHCTPANKSDTGELPRLIENTKINKGSPVFADKGYSSRRNRGFLKEHGLDSKIMFKANRNKPLTEEEKECNRQISKVRFIVERSFGCIKKHFNFQRAKYKGIIKVQAQFMLISMAHNIKKAVLAFG